MGKAVVFGASGAIGSAFVETIADRCPDCDIVAVSRRGDDVRPPVRVLIYDPDDAISLRETCRAVVEPSPPDLVVIATGILHDEGIAPEKSLRELDAAQLQRLFAVNTVLPAMIVSHLSPLMYRQRPYTIAALSARVGSISDNRLGGWYAYRASKAALNMIIRTASIELARRNPQSVIVGLHPGTVDSALSRPFQKSVPEFKLFSPEFAAGKLLDVIAGLEPSNSGGCFDWAGKEIPA
ncbi:SDR family NAD(P)-dependent oxidoreductase [Hoeflea sp. WL0058]|uniref:SDR family NAD(P)-dependent oxidoreductase n=1 Tax=Flavimaribacter sediminis TaxID=2865987 RepID=A0AAE2ZN66_9HYPH|nr:SDR family NAD(P)-dependent oxidoreductase [Flavimaribacter sediminis]